MKFSLFKGEKGESDSIVTTKDGKSLKKQKNGDKKLVLLIENTQSKNIPCQRRPRKRALLIGINYFMTENELREPSNFLGCVSDVVNMKKFIKSRYGFQESEILTMTDERENKKTKKYPSRRNLVEAMHWLVKDSQSGDSLFLHYSGHGGRSSNLKGKFDETLYPVDFRSAGPIVDDYLHHILVSPLTANVRLTTIFDCCYSGTILDLPYQYDANGQATKNIFRTMEPKPKSWLSVLSSKNIPPHRLIQSIPIPFYKALSHNDTRSAGEADVICFSSCSEFEVSADKCYIGYGCFGAMTSAFLSTLKSNKNISYARLLKKVQDLVKLDQTPTLSSNHYLDMNRVFTL